MWHMYDATNHHAFNAEWNWIEEEETATVESIHSHSFCVCLFVKLPSCIFSSNSLHIVSYKRIFTFQMANNVFVVALMSWSKCKLYNFSNHLLYRFFCCCSCCRSMRCVFFSRKIFTKRRNLQLNWTKHTPWILYIYSWEIFRRQIQFRW